MGNTLKPLHKNLQSFGSSSTHSTTYSPYENSLKGFKDLTTFSSSSTHSSSKDAGWQYIQQLINFLIKTFEETINCTDTQQKKLTKSFSETVDSFVGQFDGLVEVEEVVNVLDQFVVKHRKSFEEVVNASDILAKQAQIDYPIPINIQVLVRLIKTFQEVVNANEGSDAYEFTDKIDSTKIQVTVVEDTIDSVKISIDGSLDVTDSTNISVVPYNLVGVTGPSGSTYNTPNNPIILDPTNPYPVELPIAGDVTEVTEDNPFYPTIIIGGVTFVFNASSYME